jgi:hypothetical protein
VLWGAVAIALAAQTASTSGDSTYSSPALRAMIAAAADSNHAPPPELKGYHSRVETEVALVLRDSLGREHAAEIEQVESRAVWTRDGPYDLHVIGYRSQTVGVPYSTLSVIRGWTVPTLYGERLSLGAYVARPNARDTLTAVHPFAADRDQFYRYSGGDTVTTLHVGTRTIPIVRVRVRPDFHGESRLGAFDGELELDATRLQIVRMRGRFVILGGRETLGTRFARASGIVAAAFVEFVNAEYRGRYWLPSYQRTEFQTSFPPLGQSRPVFRIVSTIGDMAIDDTGAVVSDTTPHAQISVTWAPGDSVDSFKDWRTPIGTQSSAVQADDFSDLAPAAWRPDGPPRMLLMSGSLDRVFRFNRVEGLYLGVAPTLELRSAAPGLTLGVFGGWAFTEATARGGAYASLKSGSRTFGLRAERALTSTNDFGIPLGEDPGFSALISSVDDNDYVDRRRASLSLTQIVGSIDLAVVTAQAGFARDDGERTRLSQGLLSTNGGFRPNRGVIPGDYGFGSVDVEIHPSVSGDFLRPGVGTRVHYEYANGDISWQRAQLGLSAREYLGPVSVGAHADAGVVIGDHPPPQQMFEIGGTQQLPGYSYKQFAGDRAALFRTFVGYRFGVWQKPIRLLRVFYIPGVSPGVIASVQGGWTQISSAGAANAVRALGVDENGSPISAASDGVRATAGIGLSFFSDLAHIGVARPIDRPGGWRLALGFGTLF